MTSEPEYCYQMFRLTLLVYEFMKSSVRIYLVKCVKNGFVLKYNLSCT